MDSSTTPCIDQPNDTAPSLRAQVATLPTSEQTGPTDPHESSSTLVEESQEDDESTKNGSEVSRSNSMLVVKPNLLRSKFDERRSKRRGALSDNNPLSGRETRDRSAPISKHHKRVLLLGTDFNEKNEFLTQLKGKEDSKEDPSDDIGVGG